MQEYLSIKNFASYQHYKDRRPPWIKLHAAILEDYEFSCLQDASKAHLLLIGLLASKLNNRIPNDAEWIGRQIGASTLVDIQVLVASGFLVPVQDASDVISHRKQSAMPETETETERESKTETETSPASARVRLRLEGEDRTAFDLLLSRVPEPTTWAAECEAMLDAMPGHQRATPALLGRAIRDLTANGKLKAANIRQFRRYVEGAAEDTKSVSNGRPKSMTGTAQALCQDLRAKRNPLFPSSVPPVWKDGLADGTAEAVRPFLSRIFGDDPKGEGTLVAQLARALEEATA